MFFITGDTHANWLRFHPYIFPEQNKMSKKDFVLVLGDFGIWDDSKEQKEALDILNDRPFTTLFISGNHSNYDILNSLPVEKWKGGEVNFIRKNIIHLRRGQIFEIAGRKIFTFGGAASHDIQNGILETDMENFDEVFKKMLQQKKRFRVNHESWWKEELPSKEEIEIAKANLKQYDNSVDYVFTHCASTSIQDVITQGNNEYSVNNLTEFLEWVQTNVNYGMWAFGHYHKDSDVDMRHHCLYRDIVKIW